MAHDLINIKGTKNGLVIYLDGQYEIDELKNSLHKKLESAKGFFKGAHFFLKSRSTNFTPQQRIELETICKEYGLIPKGLETKFVEEKDVSLEEENFKIKGLLPSEIKGENHFIQCNIRNGQRLHFKGNVIIIGDVNPGGYISATGSIMIMGTLRGIAHAGTDGNKNAYILAHNFCPHQIRIANIIARNPETRPVSTSHAEIAQLENNTIMIQSYSSKKLKKII